MHTELAGPIRRVSAALRHVAEQQPLIHCLTNIVVAQFTANVLLAVGTSPAMVENASESGPFAAVGRGRLVNLGTLSAEREVADARCRRRGPRARSAVGPRPGRRGVLAHRGLAAEC